MWGWYVANPITVEIPRGWLGLYLNISILFPVSLDYCIAANICNEWFKRTFLPNSWSTGNDTILSRLVYTLPTTVLAITCVLVIPEFDTLIGLFTSISIIGMSTWAPTLAWEWGGRSYKTSRVLMWIMSLIGLACNAAGLAGSLYEIVTADYSFGSFCE